MPRIYETSILGHDVQIEAPGTFDELAQIMGPDEAMEACIMGLLYRGPFARYRAKYFENIEKRLGIKLEHATPAKVDESGKVLEPAKYPTDTKSQKQLADKAKQKGMLPNDDPTVDFQDDMEEAIKSISFAEALKSERTGGKIAKEWIELARKGIARVNEEKNGSFEDFLANVRKTIPSATLPDEPTEEDVARLMKRKYDIETKAAKAKAATGMF